MNVRLIHSEEYPEASAVALKAFEQGVAPLYPAEGIETFYQYAQPDAIQHRDSEGYITFVAKQDHIIIGMLHARTAHLAMLFVSPSHQKTGVAHNLIASADKHSRLKTVNASPNSVSVYEKLGFIIAGTTEQHKGMWVIPMRRNE